MKEPSAHTRKDHESRQAWLNVTSQTTRKSNCMCVHSLAGSCNRRECAVGATSQSWLLSHLQASVPGSGIYIFLINCSTMIWFDPLSRMMAVVVGLLSCVALLNGQQDNQVAVKWGVADSTATVGRLYRMHIPGDAFSGKVLSYTVECSGGSPLPNWLEFDSQNNVLQGIPTSKETEQVYLTITAHGPTDEATVTSTIFIRDVPSHTSGMPLRFQPSGPEFVRCQDKEPETVATIIVDVDFETLTLPKRLKLLNNFIVHMQLHEEMIKMLPVGNFPMHDASALVSGTGDCLTPKTSGLFISWPVGCGQVKEGHFPVLQKLDDDSGSGRMAKVLGYSVIGWRVTNSHFQAPSRKRRQVHTTPTPVVTPIMPTKTDTKQDKTDDADGKMTHQVLVTQSPTFIHPTATHSPMLNTELFVAPPVRGEVKDKPDKVMPTETMAKVPQVSKTKEMPVIKPTVTDDSSKPTDIPTVDGCMPGQMPEVQHPIQKQSYQIGEVIDYHIPEDTFEDCEVGGTPGLELMLFLDTTDKIRPDFFLQFDAGSQRIFGLPMDGDIGRYNFTLIARKKSNLFEANTPIMIQIRGAKNRKKNHELSVTVSLDYKSFMENVTDRVNLAKKVASVYGDPDAKKLIVTKIMSGSVVYGWANSSLPSKQCPAEEITDLVRKLVNEDGSLTHNAVNKMKPYVLLSVDAKPAGACEDDPNFPVVMKPKIITTQAVEEDNNVIDGDDQDVNTNKVIAIPEVDDGDKMEEDKTTKKPGPTTVESVAKSGKNADDEDDIWITTVIPAVVIVVILLIALLIACILYRKKRKGKMNIEEQNTFINKGAPVIFPDELEDKPSDVNKPLLLEGSLAPPPEYHRGTSESPERHISSNNRNIRNNITSPAPDDSITEMPEKPYEPPPPVTASSNNKQPRTTHSQQPYSQPPQILP